MDEEIKKRFEIIEKRLDCLENKKSGVEVSTEVPSLDYKFDNKNLSHNLLVESLLKSEFCHLRNGLSRDEIITIFRINGRPVVQKKINNLINAWKRRKKIEAIKEDKKLKYFWIENDN